MANTDNPWTVLKAGAVSLIQILNLSGDATGFAIGTHVYSDLEVDESNIIYPCVIVTSQDETEQPFAGDTNAIDTWLSLKVLILDEESERQNDREADYFAWRLAIKDRFHQKANIIALSPATYCNNWSEASFLPNFPRQQGRFMHIVSALRIKFWVRQTRT